MQGISCPFCEEKMYRARWPDPGKVTCIHCGRDFLVSYNRDRGMYVGKKKGGKVKK